MQIVPLRSGVLHSPANQIMLFNTKTRQTVFTSVDLVFDVQVSAETA